MMQGAWPVVLMAGLFLSGCVEAIIAERVSDVILDDLQRASADLDGLTLSRDSIVARAARSLAGGNCDAAARTADSLRSGRAVLNATIASFKSKLAGSAPDDHLLADSLFDVDSMGHHLHRGMIAFHALTARIVQGDSTAARVAQLASHMETPPGPETWRTRNFHHVPAAAANAILSKYASDIAEAEAIGMEKLLRDRTDRGLPPLP